MPVLAAPERAWRSMPAEMSNAIGRAPAAASQREHIAAPQPTSSTSLAETSPSRWASASRSRSGDQTKSATPRKAPCAAW
jgi:hypothetical protein